MSGMGISLSGSFSNLNSSSADSLDSADESFNQQTGAPHNTQNANFIPEVGYEFTFRNTPYKLIKFLGRGTSKKVFAAAPKNQDSESFPKDKIIAVLFSSILDEKKIENEREVLERVRDIPGCLQMLEEPKRIGYEVQMITNFCAGGTLDSWAERKPLLSRLLRVLQVAEALQKVHSKGIAHGDIKSENIGVDNHGNAILLDWGSSTNKANIRTGDYLGTQAYLPPGTYSNSPLELDVFALGAVLFEMTIKSIKPASLLEKVSKFTNRNAHWMPYRFYTTQDEMKAVIKKLPEPIEHLLSEMLKFKPEERMKIDEVVSTLREIIESPQLVFRQTTNVNTTRTRQGLKFKPVERSKQYHISERLLRRQNRQKALEDQMNDRFQVFSNCALDQEIESPGSDIGTDPEVIAGSPDLFSHDLTSLGSVDSFMDLRAAEEALSLLDSSSPIRYGNQGN